MEVCGPCLAAASLNPGTVFDSNTMPPLPSSVRFASSTLVFKYSPLFLPVQLLMGSVFKATVGENNPVIFVFMATSRPFSKLKKKRNQVRDESVFFESCFIKDFYFVFNIMWKKHLIGKSCHLWQVSMAVQRRVHYTVSVPTTHLLYEIHFCVLPGYLFK